MPLQATSPDSRPAQRGAPKPQLPSRRSPQRLNWFEPSNCRRGKLADRTPIFELHILPMFRQLDRQHMLRVNSQLDLLDYDKVKANAGVIVQFAGGDSPTMPPSEVGGPWPSEWKALFGRWIAGGFRRLSLGTGRNYRLPKSVGTAHLLPCTVAIPTAPDSSAWFDIID